MHDCYVYYSSLKSPFTAGERATIYNFSLTRLGRACQGLAKKRSVCKRLYWLSQQHSIRKSPACDCTRGIELSKAEPEKTDYSAKHYIGTLTNADKNYIYISAQAIAAPGP